MSLSGGQRQRLALARAVLARPRILVLDDTLSALDVHTEALVEEALRRVLARRDRHRRRAPRVDGDAGRQGGAAPGRHHHPRRHAQRPAGHGPGLPRAARGRRRARGGSSTPDERAGDARPSTTPPPAPPPRSEWRGVAAEHRDDELPTQVSLLLRRAPAGCSADLLRPHKTVAQGAARRRAGRERRPALDPLPRQGGHRPRHPADPGDRRHARTLFDDRRRSCSSPIVVQAVTRQTFLVMSGQDRPGHALRRCGGGCSRHFQRLSPAFHDEYTSGRVISRQTSDMDAIYEMLETGFDGLVTAVLTLVGRRGPAAHPRRQARRWSRCSASRSCSSLTNWFRKRVGEDLPASPARRSRW